MIDISPSVCTVKAYKAHKFRDWITYRRHRLVKQTLVLLCVPSFICQFIYPSTHQTSLSFIHLSMFPPFVRLSLRLYSILDISNLVVKVSCNRKHTVNEGLLGFWLETFISVFTHQTWWSPNRLAARGCKNHLKTQHCWQVGLGHQLFPFPP